MFYLWIALGSVLSFAIMLWAVILKNRFSGWKGTSVFVSGVLITIVTVFLFANLASPVLDGSSLWSDTLEKRTTWHVKGVADDLPPCYTHRCGCGCLTIHQEDFSNAPDSLTFSTDDGSWHVAWWEVGEQTAEEDFRWCAVFQDELKGGGGGGMVHTAYDRQWDIAWVQRGATNPLYDPLVFCAGLSFVPGDWYLEKRDD